MSREIKFKFWMTKSKKMISDGYHTLIDSDGDIWDHIAEPYEDCLTEIRDAIPLQYIGMTDLAQNPVFECDIVEVITNKQVSITEPVVRYNPMGGEVICRKTVGEINVYGKSLYKVELISGRWKGVLIRHNSPELGQRIGFGDLNLFGIPSYNVVGNIYESPELLEPLKEERVHLGPEFNDIRKDSDE